MNHTPKRWIRLGLGAALIGTAGLAACGGEGGEAGESAMTAPGVAGAYGEGGEMGEGEGGEGVAAVDPAMLLPVDQRAAMIASEVTVAAALARSGQLDDAAEHLRIAIDDIRPGGLSRLVEKGFDPDLIESAEAALSDGAAPDEIEARIAAAEANVAEFQANAGGDPVALVIFLVKRCENAYRAGVSFSNEIDDPILYQKAYGYAVTAQEAADRIESGDASGLQLELRMLVLMWPSIGPIAGDVPAPPSTFLSQVSRIGLELSTFE
ncbi:hypothetical protein [uncultured Hyphomonas sp.]|uniref:hypothetical protein n=1 Tax=uncultured Hyphomonas sp. TaxID=225298 RepID=UPI002AABF773|nr:hypothetical protein [uncultured Hyphomonas sp.]